MGEVRSVTREAAHTAGAQIKDPDALEAQVLEFVTVTEFVYGSTVAFEPDMFPERGRCFAPYSWKTSDGQVHSGQLGTETDYYEEEWYAETKKSGREYWSEPYFDEGGAKIMMCTFSVPLFDENGSLVAIMTADVGIEDLQEYVSTICPYPDSYIVLRSRNGVTFVNGERESTVGSGTIIIKGVTENGWTVELVMPFTYLMHGDTGVLFLIGVIFLLTVICTFFIDRMIYNLQQQSSEEYINVIDAISSSFTSIFLVDLIANKAVVLRDPEGYEDFSASDADETFTAKMNKLIEYDGHPVDREMLLREIKPDTIRARLRTQERYQIRFRKLLDGGLNWHELHVFTLERNKDGEPARAVIAFTNVNESVKKEKQAQDTLEQALNMAQSASKAKTDFLFNMSHDIRTPMNAIIGFTNMAKKHIDDKAKVTECLEKTQQSSNLLLSLINSVLDVSRTEAGHTVLEESPADVRLSFAAVENTLTEMAAANDISLSFEMDEIRDRYVFCDLDRCNRIFVNIISNAIKYTHEGGSVRVSCEQIGSDREGYGNYRYTFADNGIGMSEEFQKHVFDQFARENSSTVSDIQGSGLGLAVCKSFVTLMGGTIECSSKLGEGTVFTVTLPFRLQEGARYIDPYSREEVNSDVQNDRNEPFSVRGRRIQLVEDNELNREIAEEMLTEEGRMTDSAENGAVAVSLLKEKGPEYYDCILMDIQMPVMNGYEATKAIREMYPQVHIPIIAVSANAFDEDKAASRKAGMDAHVAKPLNVSELLGTLARFI